LLLQVFAISIWITDLASTKTKSTNLATGSVHAINQAIAKARVSNTGLCHQQLDHGLGQHKDQKHKLGDWISVCRISIDGQSTCCCYRSLPSASGSRTWPAQRPKAQTWRLDQCMPYINQSPKHVLLLQIVAISILITDLASTKTKSTNLATGSVYAVYQLMAKAHVAVTGLCHQRTWPAQRPKARRSCKKDQCMAYINRSPKHVSLKVSACNFCVDSRAKTMPVAANSIMSLQSQ